MTANGREGRSLQLKVVTRSGRGLGFRLAGAPVVEVEAGKVEERFRDLLADPASGVLAVEEELLAEVPVALLARASREGIPVLLPISLPARWQEAGGGEAYVAALVRRAIGYHVRIQR